MDYLMEFIKLMKKIYGKTYFEENWIRKNDTLERREVENDCENEKQNRYLLRVKDHCTECKDLFKQLEEELKKKNKKWIQKMDFPGWWGPLIFKDNEPVKKIMIIGYEPNAPLKDENEDMIQITYDMGIRDEESNYVTGDMEEYLKYFNLMDMIEDLYLTDRCKCYNGGDKRKRKECFKKCKEYLIKEINLIRPELIIFHGPQLVNVNKNNNNNNNKKENKFIEELSKNLDYQPEIVITNHCSYYFNYNRFSKESGKSRAAQTSREEIFDHLKKLEFKKKKFYCLRCGKIISEDVFKAQYLCPSCNNDIKNSL